LIVGKVEGKKYQLFVSDEMKDLFELDLDDFREFILIYQRR
jgi:hypothetical protein